MINYRWEFEKTEQQSIYTLSYCQPKEDEPCDWLQIAQITSNNLNSTEDDIEGSSLYTTDTKEVKASVIATIKKLFKETKVSTPRTVPKTPHDKRMMRKPGKGECTRYQKFWNWFNSLKTGVEFTTKSMREALEMGDKDFNNLITRYSDIKDALAQCRVGKGKYKK